MADDILRKEEFIHEEQPKLQGDRYNTGKLQWSLVDWDAFEPMVKVLEFGAKKYAAHNWKKGLSITDTLDSLQRHINELRACHDLDKESGIHHIGHIQCNVMFLGYMFKYRPDMDDRFKDPNKQDKVDCKSQPLLEVRV